MEIILVTLIISALTGVFVPKMSKIIDTATLNYEVRKFRSEFLFAQSLGRSSTYEPMIFYRSSISKGTATIFKTFEKNYRIENNGNLIREKNLLPPKFRIFIPNNLQDVSFDSFGKSGKSGTYTFISPQKNKRYLRLDSVGRLHIEKDK